MLSIFVCVFSKHNKHYILPFYAPQLSLQNFGTQADDDQQELTVGPKLSHDRKPEMDFEACSKLEDLNLEVRKTSLDKVKENLDGDSFRRYCTYEYTLSSS